MTALRESARKHTCGTCGKSETWSDGWRWGTDRGENYYNPHVVSVFCSDDCEATSLGKDVTQ